MTLTGLADPVPVLVTPPIPELQVAVYRVTVLPLLAPGVKDTLTTPMPVSETPIAVGAAGEPTITAGEGDDASPMPRAFVAVTVQV